MITIPEKVKNLLKQDGTRKNFRVHFPNGERADITNENISEESVTLTESICSESKLKFGQCESPVLEFETIGVGKIKGCTIEASLEIDVTDVIKCKNIFLPGTHDFSMAGAKTGGKIKVTGAPGFSVTIEYTHPEPMEVGYSLIIADYFDEGEVSFDIDSDALKVDSITVICDGSVTVEYDNDVNFDYSEPDDLSYPVYAIPYGVFVVDSCKKQADMNYRKVIAYSSYNFEIPQSYITSVKNLIGPNVSGYFSAEELEVFMNPQSYEFYDVTDLGGDYRGKEFTLEKGGHTYKLGIAMVSFTGVGTYARGGGLSIIDEIHTPGYANGLKEIREAIKAEGIGKLTEKANAYELSSDFFDYEDLPADSSDDYISKSEQNIFRDVINAKEHNYYVIKTNSAMSRIYRVNDDLYIPYVVALTKDGKQIAHAYESVFDIIVKVASPYFDTGPYYIAIGTQTVTIKSETSSHTKKYKKANIENLSKIDAREMLSAYYELNGKSGISKRSGGYKSFYLADNFGNPAATITKDDFTNLWYDDDYSLPIGRLICTYKNSGGSTKFMEKVLVDDYDKSAYRTYSITFNYLIQNNTYADSQIARILETMAGKINDNISFMPMELSIIGRPDLEAGDVVTIVTDEGNITGFVEKRELSGISALKDVITSEDETASNSSSGIKSDYDEDTGVLTIYS